MPYIKPADRPKIVDENNSTVNYSNITTPGELNYAITMMLIDYAHSKKHSYTTYNEIIGVLECAKLEFYRRLAADYEDDKKQENGDVY